MAQYLILIYETEASYAEGTSELWAEVGQAHTRFAEQIGELGATMLGGNALQPTMTATTIRGDVVTDGPFAETKEALGGYYLIEAADLDQALAVGKLCPAPFGGVEVRPVLDNPTGMAPCLSERVPPELTADDVARTDAVRAAVADAYRAEWAFVLAATARTTRDLDLAEECAAEAFSIALVSWVRDGVPRSPGAWLTTTARRRAVDQLRRDKTLRAKLPLLVDPETGTSQEPAGATAHGEGDVEDDVITDDRLRLVFTCCHPALAREAQVALTLRLVCGLSTADIASAFLVSEPTMAARVTRAKKKIAGARIPYRVPEAAELPDRLDAVLTVVHLLFTAGHTAPAGAELVRDELVDRAVALGRMLTVLMPDEREALGLLALMLITDARRDSRLDESGQLALLEDQDRSRWDQEPDRPGPPAGARRAARRPARTVRAAGGDRGAARRSRPPGRAPTGAQILGLYDLLVQAWPSPVVALNRCVAVSMVHGPAGRRSTSWPRSRPAAASRRTTTSRPPRPTCCAGSAGPTRRPSPTARRSRWSATTWSGPSSPVGSLPSELRGQPSGRMHAPSGTLADVSDYREINRQMWDERAPAHAASPGYAVEQFVDDPEFLSHVVRFDRPRLGDLTRAARRTPAVPHRHRHRLAGPARRPDDRAGLLRGRARAGPAARRASPACHVDFVQSDLYDAVAALGAGPVRPGLHRRSVPCAGCRTSSRWAAGGGRPAPAGRAAVHPRGPPDAVGAGRHARPTASGRGLPVLRDRGAGRLRRRHDVRRDRRRRSSTTSRTAGTTAWVRSSPRCSTGA